MPNSSFESSKSNYNLLSEQLNSKLNSYLEERCNDSASSYPVDSKQHEIDSDSALDLKISSSSSSCTNRKCKKESEEGITPFVSQEESRSKCDNGKSFPCPNCHKTFATQADLKAHLMRHITQHPHVCFACGKGFKYDHTLDFHIKSQHGVDGTNSINMKTLGRKNLKSKRGSFDDLFKTTRAIHLENEINLINGEAACEDANNNHLNSSLTSEFCLQGNLTPRSIQIKSEKVLITLLEGSHPITEQSYSLYKCCLCGFAFPNLEPVGIHIQLMHSNHSNFICDKCGATFKWRSELELHEQLHKAMDQSSKSKQLLIPSFLQPNLVLMNPYLGEEVTGSSFNNDVEDSNNNIGKNGNTSNDKSNNNCNNNNSSNNSNNNNQNNSSNSNHSNNTNSNKACSNSNDNNNNSDSQGLNLCMNNRNEDKTTSEVFDDKEEQLSLDTKVLSEIKKESKGLKMFQYHTNSIPQPVGDIEETTPGQFKCRFCDKTFDRIFSVHRHERVHTGYKPCICKACGRGFSEKRNLRHHIIRFHSDGSGRELLKRARKDKTLAGNSFFRKAINRLANHSQSLNLLNNNNNNNNSNNNSTNDNESNIVNNNINSNNNNDNDENQSDRKRLEEENTRVDNMTTEAGHNMEECNMEVESDAKSNTEKELQEIERGSSFRRKKSKPSKKVISIENHLESGAKLKQEIGDDSLSSVKDKMDNKDSDSNEANSSINSDSENKMRLHGAFFSSYNPRLGVVEKPVKRAEACRPLMGPDGRYLYPCVYCQKTFCSLSDLNRHINFHEDVRPFKCEFCDYQSRTNSQLKVHMMRHAGIKQYLCHICNYNGVTQSDLNRHCKTRSHVLRSGNICPLCSLGFSTPTLLKDHVIKFHDSSSLSAPKENSNSRNSDSSLAETDNSSSIKFTSDKFSVNNLL